MPSIRALIRALALAAGAVVAVPWLVPSVGTAVGETVSGSASGLDLGNLDRTCKPCDDFYQFATGGWRHANTIPAGHATWGSFNVLQQQNEEALHAILQDAAAEGAAPIGSDRQKLGTFYRACMDEAAIERAGTGPIAALLRDIGAVTDAGGVAREAAALQAAGVGDGPRFGSMPDRRNSSRTIAALSPGGLGMPDRSYYVKTDAKDAAIQSAYHAYVAVQLQNLGETQTAAIAAADAIVALETALAKATPERTELFDPTKTYHPTTVAALQKATPQVPWNAFFAAFGAPPVGMLNVVSPDFITAYAGQLAEVPVATWKQYLRFRVADSYAEALPKRFGDASFLFRSGVMQGIKEQLPLWQRCVSATDSALRTPLGKAYVARYFTPQSKARAVAMVDNLQATLRSDIRSLSWMSASTKRYAIAKLDAFTKKIGYPDRWQDYATLQIPQDQPFASLVLAVRSWNSAVDVARIGRPTDRSRWGMTTPTVNAYYSPSGNEIVFPAGILQPPFYDPQADDAVNYGAIGAVIGHEMTHGFDNDGRLYDAKGNVRNWWTPQDAAHFTARAQCVIDEYDALEPVPGVHENGHLVQGEAIADLGGATIAFKAFQRTAEYRAHRRTDGFTPEQRFFLAYAAVWRSVETEAYARQLAAINEHADPRLRVNGTVSNMPAFAQAFMCPLRAAMVRPRRCEIW